MKSWFDKLCILLMIATAAVSCGGEHPSNLEAEMETDGLVGKILAVFSESKAHIEDNVKCRWDDGDSISLSPQSNEKTEGSDWVLTTQDSGATALFVGDIPEGLTTFCAAYPASSVEYWNPGSNDSAQGRCRFQSKIKAEQTVSQLYSQDGMPVFVDPSVLWFGGYSAGTRTLQFSPLGTYIRFTIPQSARYSLESICVKSTDSSDVDAEGSVSISGTCRFEYKSGRWSEVITGSVYKSVTLHSPSSRPLKPGVYLMAIHPSSKYPGLSFVFTNTAGQRVCKAVSASGNFTFEMGKIYDTGVMPDSLFDSDVEPVTDDMDGIKTYTYPAGTAVSSDYEVYVEDRAQTVFSTSEPDICAFGCTSRVSVKVSFPDTIVSSVAVRPLSKDFSHHWNGNILSLSMSPGERVVVERNDDRAKPLFIFANPIESAPSPDDASVTVYKAGTISDAGQINMSSGETLYIEGGAWVRGFIRATDADNISIRGCGVLDVREATEGAAIRLTGCDEVELRDIITLNCSGHTTHLQQCSNVTVDNYKVAAVYNVNNVNGHENDALNLISCNHAAVSRCLSYCHDDAFCIKSVSGASSSDISYNDCIAWNVHGGNSFDIGYEVGSDITNVRYKQIYSIHSRGNTNLIRSSDLGIHVGASGTVSDVTYEDVYLEESDNWTMMLRIWDKDSGLSSPPAGYDPALYVPGRIKGVRLKNIYVLYDMVNGSYLDGYDAYHRVEDVTVDGLYIGGVRASSAADAKIYVNEYASLTIN